jgi:hypothetical protein
MTSGEKRRHHEDETESNHLIGCKNPRSFKESKKGLAPSPAPID